MEVLTKESEEGLKNKFLKIFKIDSENLSKFKRKVY